MKFISRLKGVLNTDHKIYCLKLGSFWGEHFLKIKIMFSLINGVKLPVHWLIPPNSFILEFSGIPKKNY